MEGSNTPKRTADNWWNQFKEATGETRTPAKAEDRKEDFFAFLKAQAEADEAARKAREEADEAKQRANAEAEAAKAREVAWKAVQTSVGALRKAMGDAEARAFLTERMDDLFSS